MNFRPIILIVSALAVFVSCTEKNRLDVSLTNPLPELTVLHLDSLLFHTQDSLRPKQVNSLSDNEHALFTIYVEDVMRNSSIKDPYMMQKLNMFLDNGDWQALQQTIDSVFYPFDYFNKQLQLGLAHFQYHFPNKPLPSIYTYNSGFNYGVFPSENSIGIGLEWFIGSENVWVKRLPYDMFPNYIKTHMEPKFLAVDAIKGWLMVTSFEDKLLDADMLENLIFYGKTMYKLDACFPKLSDAIKMGYSEDEITWANKNKRNIWAEIVENNWLFSKDSKLIKQWFLDAPFTAGLPQESPGKLGVWLGWEMVRQYMNKNESVSLQSLEKVQAKTILQSFKPE